MKRLAFVLSLLFVLCSVKIAANTITSTSTDEDSTTILTEKGDNNKIKPNSSGRCITVKYRYDSYNKSVKLVVDENLGISTICLLNPFNGTMVNYLPLSTPGTAYIIVPDAGEFEICLIDENARSYYGFLSIGI